MRSTKTIAKVGLADEVRSEPLLVTALDKFIESLHAHRTLAISASKLAEINAKGDTQDIIQKILKEFSEGSSQRHIHELRQFTAALGTIIEAFDHPPTSPLKIPKEIKVKISSRTAQLIMTRLVGEIKRHSAEKSHPELILKLCLTGAVTTFEILFGRIVRFYYDRARGNLENRQISYSDIWQFSSISELNEHLMELAVDGVLRQSVDDWRKFLTERIHIDLEKTGIPWNDIALIIQHRHLIVHADNIASQQFAQKFQKANKLTDRIQVTAGKALPVKHDYIMLVLDLLEIGGMLLALDTWAHVNKNERLPYGRIVEPNLSAAILRERWLVGAVLAEWTSKRGDIETGVRTRFQLDSWMCRLRANDVSAPTEIAAYDPSALRPDLAARYHALRNNADMCIKALASMNRSERLDLLNSPYFATLRQDTKIQQYRHKVISQTMPKQKVVKNKAPSGSNN